MYKVFLNQNVIILTSEIQLGSNITVLPLKKTSIGNIISNVKKHKKIYLYHHNSKKLKLLKLEAELSQILKRKLYLFLEEINGIYQKERWIKVSPLRKQQFVK